MNKTMLMFLAVISCSIFSSHQGFAAPAAGVPACALITKAGRGVEVIPPQGRVVTRFKNDFPIPCGTMVITHHEPVWVQLASRVQFRLAPDTFVEFSKGNGDPLRLFRGNILVDAPVGTDRQVLLTPNGKTILDGGVAWIQYQPAEKQTTVSSLVRSCRLQNRFYEAAEQVLHSGESSHLAVAGDRIVPSQPELADSGSIGAILAQFELSPEDVQRYSFAVNRSFEGKLKSFTAELENWTQNKEEPSREIASVSKKAVLRFRR